MAGNGGSSVEVSVKLALQQLISDAARAAGILEQQLKDIEVGVTIDKNGNLRDAQGRFISLKGNIDETTTATKNLENAGESLSGGFKGLVTIANQFQENVSKASLYTQALREVSQQLDAAGSSVNNFSSQARAAAVQFDSARAAVDSLGADGSSTGEAMRQLAEDLEYNANSTELLQASYDVLSSRTETLTSGMSDADVTTKILDASVRGAIGGFSETGVVADALTTALNAYGESADQAGVYVDKFSAVQNAGKITIDQYAKQIGRVAPIAAQAGLSLDELNGFIATATVKGVQAESAFAGIRQAIANTLKPSVEASKYAAELGIQFDATALRTKGLSGILGELNARGLDTPEVLTKLFGSVEAVAAIAPSAGAGFATLTANIDASANSAGAAQKAYDAVANSLEGQQKRALNEVNEALVSLGNGVTKAIVPLLGGLAALTGGFNQLPEPIKEAVGVLVAVTGGALTTAGALAAIAAVIPVVTAGFTTVSAAFGLTAGGATAAAAGLTATGTAGGAAAAGLTATTAAATGAAPALATVGGAGTAAAGGLTATGAAAGGAATGGLAALTAAIIPLLPLLGVVAVGAAAISFASFTRDLTTAGAAIDQANQQITTSTGVALQAAGRTKAAVAQLNEARSSGRSLTEQEVASNQRLVRANELRLKQLNEDLELARQMPAANKDQEQSRANLIQQTQSAIASLQGQNNALKQLISNTGAATTATEEQAASAGDLGEKYQASTAQLDNALKLRQATIAEAVSSGNKSEEEGRQANLQAEGEYYSQRLATATAALNELKALRSTTTDTDELEKINADILKLESDTSDARLNIAKNLAEQRAAVEQAAAEKVKEAIASTKLDESRQITGVRQRQAGGGLDEKAAAEEIDRIKEASTQKQITLIQQRLQVVRAGSDEEKALTQELASLQQTAAEQEIARQERVKQARIQAIADANKQAEAAITQAQNNEIAGIRQLEGQRVISREQAEAQISQVRSRAAAAEVEATRSELEQITALRAEGVLSEEEFASRRMELETQISQQNLQAIEVEMGAQQSLRDLKIQALQESAEAAKVEGEVRAAAINAENERLNQQTNLLSAQSNLLKAQSELKQQRLEFAAKEAERLGQIFQAEELRKQAIAAQIVDSERQAILEQQQLELKAQQLDLEIQSKQIQAEQAAAAADLAVAEAESSGVSQDRLRTLQRLRDLANEQVGNINAQRNAAQNLLSIERASLATQQQKTREALQQQQLDQARSLGGGSGTRRAYNLSGADLTASREARAKFDQIAAQNRVTTEYFDQRQNRVVRAGELRTDSFREDLLREARGMDTLGGLTGGRLREQFANQLTQSGYGNIANLATALNKIGGLNDVGVSSQAKLRGEDVVAALDKYATQVNSAIASRGNTYYVQTTQDPATAVGNIQADLARSNLRRAQT